jgi:hypothetical protein
MYRGWLVLLNESYPVADRYPKDPDAFRYEHKLLLGDPNGCFELERYLDYEGQPWSETSTHREHIKWTTDSDGSVVFALFRTPDAGYEVKLTVSERGFRGVAERWHGIIDLPETPPDEVRVVRKGEGTIESCPVEPRREHE